jgi:glutamyl-tRNA reductase
MNQSFIESLKVETYNFFSYGLKERENILCGVDVYRNIIPEFLKKNPKGSIVPLITCGRIEFIYTADNFLNLDGFEKIAGWKAFGHIVSVLSGVKTLIFGETHIVNQVKSAFFEAKKQGWCGNEMLWLISEALRISKIVRNEVNIEEKNFSSFVLDKAHEIFGDVKDKILFVAGTGAVAHDVFKIANYFKKLIIYSHSKEKAKERIDRLKNFLNCDIDFASSVKDGVEIADVAVFATRHPGFLLKKEYVLGRQKELLVIDFSVPRNVDPEISNFGKIWLFNVDSAKQLYVDPEKLDLAEKLIEREIEKLKRKLALHQDTKELVQLKLDFEYMIFEHLKKYTNLSDDEIEKISSSLSKKLLSRFFEDKKSKAFGGG